MAEDKKEFHQFECEEDVPADFCGDYMYLRLIFRFINIFDGSVEELEKHIQAHNNELTLFDMGITSDETFKSYHKKFLLPCLNKRTTYFPSEMHIERMQKFIETHPKLNKLWEEHGAFLDDLMEKVPTMMKIMNKTSIVTNEINLNLDENESLVFANAPAYRKFQIMGSFDPLQAMLTHACHDNIFPTHVNNKGLWVVSHPIKAGDRITLCKIDRSCQKPLENRREELQRTWHFHCECEACVNDYPWFHLLPRRDPSFEKNIKGSETIMEMMHLQIYKDEKKMSDEYDECRDYINNNYEKLWPSRELSWSISELESLFENASLHQSFDV